MSHSSWFQSADHRTLNVKDSSQVALAFVQGLASSLDPGGLCICWFSASVTAMHCCAPARCELTCWLLLLTADKSFRWRIYDHRTLISGHTSPNLVHCPFPFRNFSMQQPPYGRGAGPILSVTLTSLVPYGDMQGDASENRASCTICTSLQKHICCCKAVSYEKQSQAKQKIRLRLAKAKQSR